MKINHKVSHREWDEASLSIEEFVKFDAMYHTKNHGDDGLAERSDLYPTFVFDEGSVYVDESWNIDNDGRVSMSSYAYGVMCYSDTLGQYTECVYGREKELGHLITIEFTVDDDMLKFLNE